jgi:tRNA A-37 threonylcarbamoyl transferase component Bud32
MTSSSYTHHVIKPLALYQQLADFHIINDAEYKHLQFEDLCSQASEILLIAKSFRREVYIIKTSFGNFFLKYSPIARKKDQHRFALLPWRITTEWRILKRLKKKEIPAPQRVLFGYKGRFPCHGFFLVTKDVGGSGVDCFNPEHIFNLAGFLAFLHDKGIFHRDLHPENILFDPSGSPVLIDVQEVYFLPWMPHRLKISNLGQLWRYLSSFGHDKYILSAFLEKYKAKDTRAILPQEVLKKSQKHLERFYISRSKRCCKNSTEFQVLKKKKDGINGYKKRDFQWDIKTFQTALHKGKSIKGNKLLKFHDVCLKIHNKKPFHKNRSLAAWKMARQLTVRGVNVPEALAYLHNRKTSYFLSRFYTGSLNLNPYLLSIQNTKEKEYVLRSLAEWIRSIHNQNIWQRDFKSSNVLVYQGQFMMVDLEGVKRCRHLSFRKKVINLAQLNASIGNAITVKDRIRFFRAYCQGCMPPRKRRRKIYEKIHQLTQEKNTKPFGLDLKQLS